VLSAKLMRKVAPVLAGVPSVITGCRARGFDRPMACRLSGGQCQRDLLGGGADVAAMLGGINQ